MPFTHTPITLSLEDVKIKENYSVHPEITVLPGGGMGREKEFAQIPIL